uniref:CUB domain-containing protein n=1 Tax=Haemonchus contortus TaxID=6289 RepID=A0A7I4YCP5_HAECO|nr:Plasminogen [Haemonchus contortus]
MRSILLLLFAHYTFANVINYQFHDDNDNEVNECIERSMEALMDETCLFFRQTDDHDAFVNFVQSGHCSWQESNRTVHLNPKCISDDFCYEIIGRVLSIDKPRSHIARHLNLHYNCTEKCTIECQHSGTVQDDCTCKCAYGFSGSRCEQLAKQASFTDSSCGVIDVEGDGVVALSTYPSPRSKITFCQWLLQTSDPWAVIEVDIERLGLDGEDLRPGSVCNDLFTAFGEEELVGQIPCDGSQNVTRLRSKSNWLLLELRSDPYSESSVTGPLLRHRLKRTQTGVRIYSEGMTSPAFLPSIAAIALALIVVRIF